jgi:hypothetical protein
VLKSLDKDFVEETILAGTRTWTPKLLALPDLQVLRAIKKTDPEFWDGLDRAMAAKHWEGYGDWLIGRDGADSDDETEIMSTTPSTSVQMSEEAEGEEVAASATEGNLEESSVLEERTILIIAVFPAAAQPIVFAMNYVPATENSSPTIEDAVSAEVTSSSSRYVPTQHLRRPFRHTGAYTQCSFQVSSEGGSLVVSNDVSHQLDTAVTGDTPSTASEQSPSSDDALSPSERTSMPSEESAMIAEVSLSRANKGSPSSAPLIPTSPLSSTTGALQPDDGSADCSKSVDDGYDTGISSSLFNGDDERGRYLSSLPTHRSIKRSCSPLTEEGERSWSRPRLSLVLRGVLGRRT